MIIEVENHCSRNYQTEDKISPAEKSPHSPGRIGSSLWSQLCELCGERGRLERSEKRGKWEKKKNKWTYFLPGSSLGDSIDSSWRRNLWLMTLSGRLDILRTFSPRRPSNPSDQVLASLIIALKVAFLLIVMEEFQFFYSMEGGSGKLFRRTLTKNLLNSYSQFASRILRSNWNFDNFD